MPKPVLSTSPVQPFLLAQGLYSSQVHCANWHHKAEMRWLQMKSLVNRTGYIHTLTIIITSTSLKCSSIKLQVLLNNLHIFTASKTSTWTCTHGMVYSPSLPKVPHHFSQSKNYQNFRLVPSKPQWLQMLVLFCKQKKQHFIVLQCCALCMHVCSNLAHLEDVVLVTFTGHNEALSIICTTSIVICIQKRT